MLLPVLVVTEVLLLAWFEERGERSHWLTHLLVGAVVGLLGLTFWVRARGRSRGSWAGVPASLVVVVSAQMLGTIPDLVKGAGLRQGRWMDVFLGSVSAHHAPMGNLTWAVLAVGSALSYVSTVRAFRPPPGTGPPSCRRLPGRRRSAAGRPGRRTRTR